MADTYVGYVSLRQEWHDRDGNDRSVVGVLVIERHGLNRNEWERGIFKRSWNTQKLLEFWKKGWWTTMTMKMIHDTDDVITAARHRRRPFVSDDHHYMFMLILLSSFSFLDLMGFSNCLFPVAGLGPIVSCFAQPIVSHQIYIVFFCPRYPPFFFCRPVTVS